MIGVRAVILNIIVFIQRPCHWKLHQQSTIQVVIVKAT